MQQQFATRIIERNRVERRYVCPHPCCRLRFNGKEDKTNITSVKRHFKREHNCIPGCAVIIEKYKNAKKWRYDWFNFEQDKMQVEIINNEVPPSEQQETSTRNCIVNVSGEEIELASNSRKNTCSIDTLSTKIESI